MESVRGRSLNRVLSGAPAQRACAHRAVRRSCSDCGRFACRAHHEGCNGTLLDRVSHEPTT
jgi:hypothetical protein